VIKKTLSVAMPIPIKWGWFVTVPSRDLICVFNILPGFVPWMYEMRSIELIRSNHKENKSKKNKSERKLGRKMNVGDKSVRYPGKKHAINRKMKLRVVGGIRLKNIKRFLFTHLGQGVAFREMGKI